jgi:guanylate kinase
MSRREPLFLILSAPSGAGKTTLAKRLLAEVPDLRFSISYTTRAPRPSEQHGREYLFTTREDFIQRIRGDRFLEWIEVGGTFYGTSRDDALPKAGSRGVIFDLNCDGARRMKSVRPDALAVFVLPPSLAELERRLRGRGTDGETAIRERMERAQHEISQYRLFDYLVINDDIELATRRLVSIVVAEGCACRG